MLICRCPHCMEDLSSYERDAPPFCGYGTDESQVEYGYGICPICGFDIAGARQPAGALPRNTILHGKYLVGDVLGQGGFGITYIGFDLSLEVKVAIKEYYPAGSATRREGQTSVVWNSGQASQYGQQNAYEGFLKEARKMAKIDQIPSIVRVRETFLENETAYIVMDYVQGETLKAMLQRNGVMKFSDCVGLLRPMMEDLDKVHAQGLIHRDISPDNIMIQLDRRVKLLDLGAAKDLTLQREGASQLVTKKGFSPFEQYMENGNIGPWTDVYALCATIYYACFGKLPPSALERMEQDTLAFDLPAKEPLPRAAVQALQQGLALRVRDRTPSVRTLLDQLDQALTDDVQTPEAPQPEPPPSPQAEELPETAPEPIPKTISASKVPAAPRPEGQTLRETISDTGPAHRPAEPRRRWKLPRWVIPAATVAAAAALFVALALPRLLPQEVDGLEISSGDIFVGTYTGQTVNGKPSGQGTMTYAGETEDDPLTYTGQWRNGLQEGQGIMLYANGDSYEGSWSGGLYEGQGTYSYHTGALYQGEWFGGKKNGKGTMTYAGAPAGVVLQYVGEWVDDLREGQGTNTYANGAVYEGQWVQDQREGQGTVTYGENDSGGRVSYTGSWSGDQRNGQGVMTWKNGNVYEGEWKNNLPNGQGTMYYPDGTQVSGLWRGGIHMR